MKKTIVLLLSSLLVFCFTACGNSTSSETSDEPNQQVETTTQGVNDETAPTQSESDQDENDQASNSDNTPSVTIEETVIYDDNGIKITVKSLYETESSLGLFMKMENNSDKKASFYLNHCLLNGFQVMGYYGNLQAEADGESSNSFVFNKEDIAYSGGEYWESDKIATITACNAQITVDEEKIPVSFTINTSAYTGEDLPYDDSGEKVYEKNGVTVIYKEMIENESGDALTFLVKNETGKDISIDVMDTYVNGKEIGLSMWNYLFKDGISCNHMVLDPTRLEEQGIGAVESVRFVLCISDTEDYHTIAKSDEIEINLI